MIFAVPGHIAMIIDGFVDYNSQEQHKTHTRRVRGQYQVGHDYSIQPSRGKFGDPRGRILITKKWPEHKMNIPYNYMSTGYPISERYAILEGNYRPDHYEALYEQMNPGWLVRWAYAFEFVGKR